MANTYTYIDFRELSNMLYGESEYIAEFAEAAISSFNEYDEHYRKYLLNRDEENFRRAGHKIKPVAQMLNVHILLEEYENAKQLLWDQEKDELLQKSVERTSSVISEVLKELDDVYKTHST